MFLNLLEISLQFCSQYYQDVSSMKRIPFLVMEDVLDGQTVEESEMFWNYIESLPNKIDNDFFDKGNNLLLFVSLFIIFF
jgi:hypothetical protein